MNVLKRIGLPYHRRYRTLLIINPVAGKMRAKRNAYAIIEMLCRNNNDISVFITGKHGDAKRYADSNCRRFEKIVCCGGDGTLNEVISGIIEHKKRPVIGYIPCGTANDMASTLGLPSELSKSTAIAASGIPWAHDVGRFGDDLYFSYIASFGAFTKASYTTPQNVKNAFGHFAYIVDAAKELGNIKPIPMKVRWDGGELDGKFLFGAVSNATSMGGVLKLSPDIVNLCDGKFEIILIKSPDNILEVSGIINALTHQQYDNKNIVLLHAHEAEFFVKEPVSWTVDGEAGGNHSYIKIVNVHDRISILRSPSDILQLTSGMSDDKIIEQTEKARAFIEQSEELFDGFDSEDDEEETVRKTNEEKPE